MTFLGILENAPRHRSVSWALQGVRGIGLVVLVQLAVVALGAWAFVELADYADDPEELHSLDRDLLLVLRSENDPSDPIGPRWFEELVRDLTALGGFGVLAMIAAATCGYLLVVRRPHAALWLAAAVGGGMAISMATKSVLDRARPDLVPHGMHVYTQSFPSGHAMLAAVTYMTLAAMMTRIVPGRAAKLYVIALAVLTTVLVGASRVYLGVHWPSDVLGGWALGTSWAIAIWIGTAWLQRRGKVEEEAAPAEERASLPTR